MKLIGKNSYFVKALAVMLCAIIAFSSFQLGGIFTVSALKADLATVTLLTGASNEANIIEGNGTGEVSVTINEAELEWVPANEIRTQDGWWVGIKVEAPEGFSADAQYKRTKSPTNAEFEENSKSFADYKDGENYIELWFSVSPETLGSNESLGMSYQFDWNADDNYEQVINFTVESSEDKIVLNKDDETVYPLNVSDVKIEGSSKTYDGQALFAKVENVDDFDVKYVDKDGVPFGEAPSITNVGSITFDVVLYKADYEVYREEVTLEVTEAKIDDISIESVGSLVYSENENFESIAQDLVILNGEFEENDTVIWTVDGTESNSKDIPQAKIPGTYKVKLTVIRENYEKYESDEVETNILADTIEGITVTPYSGDYDGKDHDVVVVEGIRDTDTVLYSLTGNEDDYTKDCPLINEYVEEGITVYVKVKRENFEDYITFPVGFKAFVSQADQEGFKFEYENPDAIAYKEKFINKASGGQSGLSVTYKVIEGGEFVSVDNNGEITALKGNGKAIIQATLDGGENYKDAIAVYEIKTIPAKQEIYFADNIETSIYYNENNTFGYEIETFTADENGSKVVTYTIVDDDTTAKAEIEINGEKVTYKTVGNITVEASVPGNDYYDGATATYSVEVKYIPTPDWEITKPDYTDSEKLNWYANKVVIKENDAEKDWKIIEGSNALGQDGWQDFIDETNEDLYEPRKIAFKDESGNVTDLVDVNAFNIDKTAPLINKENKIIFEQNNDGAFAEFLNILLFGTFFNENLTVTVNAIDVFPDSTIDGSGIKEYQLIFENENDKFVFAQADKKFVIKGEDYAKLENFKGSVSVVVTDNVGNFETYLVNEDNSNLINTSFMIENDAPVISDIEQVSDKYFIADNGKFIHKDAFNFVFEVDDRTDKEYSGINCVKATVYVVKDHQEKSTQVLFADFSEKYTDYEEFSLKVDPVARTVNGKKIENWEDSKLKIVIEAYDNAGNVAEQKSIDNIYFDQTAPVITGFDFSLTESIDVEKDEGVYKSVTVEDYGFYFKEDVTVTIKVEEKTGEFESTNGISRAETVNYKTVNINGEVIEGILPVNNDGTVTFTINKDFKGQIYAYATDRVGNKPTDCRYCLDDKVDADGFVHPNAAIVEKLSKHNEEEHITITAPDSVGTQNNAYNFKFNGNIDKVKDYADSQLVPLYNSDVTFNVAIKDTYSGIRNVKWTIYEGEDPVKTTKEIEISNDGTISGDTDGWNIIKKDINLVTGLSNSITVSGNHNNMVLLVELTDRAGNTSYDYYVFGIDKTLPTIDVVYDDDVAKNDDAYTDHFNTNRTATITITERNFDAKNVVFKITNSDKVIPSVDLNDKKSWTEKIDSTDLDKTTYTAKINYTADGDYTFEISFADNAKNSNNGVNYGDSIAPTEFTIDKTVPTVSVAYDNNSVLNGNYYKADRVATITVNEHNFDANRVVITGTASDDGNIVSFPSISGWKSEGDVHTTTIAYKTDAKYSFDIAITDKAANETVDFVAQEFYIDKTNPVLSISGIVDQSANNSDGDIGFTITATDTNFDGVTPVLRAVIMKDGKFDVVDITDAAATAEIKNGLTYTVKNIENDGIYSITCTLVDKAGNAFSEVILEDGEGATYIEKRSGENKLITFSVNRDGSTFNLDKYTKELVDTYYVQEVTKDVTIVEINADPILKNKVMLNGKVLVEKKDYKVTLSNDDGSWYKYTYTINKELFDEEGEYNIVVTSTDKATNEAFSDVKGLTIKFVTDRTAPIVTVSGIKTDGRYKTNKQTVKLIPSDDGGSLKSLIVRTVDNDGKVIKELINLSGKELIAAIEKGEISFELGQGLYQNVQIICEDMAGNVFGLDDDELYVDITISTNSFMIFWANRVLRWGTITGVALLTAAIIFLIVYKKRKKK